MTGSTLALYAGANVPLRGKLCTVLLSFPPSLWEGRQISVYLSVTSLLLSLSLFSLPPLSPFPIKLTSHLSSAWWHGCPPTMGSTAVPPQAVFLTVVAFQKANLASPHSLSQAQCTWDPVGCPCRETRNKGESHCISLPSLWIFQLPITPFFSGPFLFNTHISQLFLLGFLSAITVTKRDLCPIQHKEHEYCSKCAAESSSAQK